MRPGLLPRAEAMYPPGRATRIEVLGPAEGWEGAARPGHFRGVATVCAKLFNQTGAAVAVFGEKDWQQFQVIRRMVADLDLPVRIVGVPTVREPDGLAMSSRNRFLAPAEGASAERLFAELRRAAQADRLRRARGRDPRGRRRRTLGAIEFGVDYFALVEGETMRPLAEPGRLRRARGWWRRRGSGPCGRSTICPSCPAPISPPSLGGPRPLSSPPAPPAPAPAPASPSPAAPARCTPPGCG